jgi:hypothetical protein
LALTTLQGGEGGEKIFESLASSSIERRALFLVIKKGEDKQ